MPQPDFKIDEREEDGSLVLAVSGELDVATAAGLEDRLERVAAKKRNLRLDLSRLEFIDSAGLRVLVWAIRDARRDGWRLEVDPHITLPVRQALRLTNLDRYIVDETAASADQGDPDR